MAQRFTKSLIGAAFIALTALGVASSVHAAGGEQEIEHLDWGFNGIGGTYDRAAMQRGYQVYREVCAACHALEHLSFRHLGDKGGPFYNPDYPNPNDNPDVKAMAKDWSVIDIDSDNGDEIDRPGIPADKFPSIFPNEPAARASNGGAYPPDLSLITKARSGGSDYLYSMLVGYKDAPAGVEMSEGMSFNTAFSGNQIAMAPPLSEDIVEYAPTFVPGDHGEGLQEIAAPAASVEQMARDVTEFLTWAGDPKMEVRKKIGFATFLYLLIFSLLLFLTYKQIWKGVKH